jgi:hypothetical protein
MSGVPKRVFYLKRRRKKVRGFRRYLREHQQRAAISYGLDLAFLENRHQDYMKLGLFPWAVNTKPPLPIRQLWVRRLVADCARWQTELSARYESFYLAVWLYEPDFGRSQLVAGVAEKQEWYKHLFTEVDKTNAPPLPAEYRLLPRINDLQWVAYAETTAIWPADLLGDDAWALKKPHWPGKTDDGRAVIVVQIGWVWVGTPKPPEPRP